MSWETLQAQCAQGNRDTSLAGVDSLRVSINKTGRRKSTRSV